MARYRHNYAAFGRLVLNSPAMTAEMRTRAGRIKDQFEATAPVGEPYEPDDHAGRYRDSAETSSGERGGPHGDRSYGRVTVTDPAAISIEFGHHVRRGPGGRFASHDSGESHEYIEGTHTLTRALDAAGDA